MYRTTNIRSQSATRRRVPIHTRQGCQSNLRVPFMSLWLRVAASSRRNGMSLENETSVLCNSDRYMVTCNDNDTDDVDNDERIVVCGS